MRKNHVFMMLFSLLFVSIYILFTSFVLADESNANVELQTQKEKKSKQEALEAIEKSKTEIKEGITNIENKLSSIKEKDEYQYYPAIRLNVDTPLFGLSSVCNQKLKITSDVSATDVALGYSIKDIVKSSSLKVPSFSVGKIVVITRDVKFDENITLSDANACILKLMQYIEQVKSVNDFLDKQIIKIYSEYIPKEKADKITSLKEKLLSLENDQKDLDKQIMKLYITTLDNAKYEDFASRYIAINSNIYIYNQVLSNVLISDETLSDYEQKVIDLESSNVALKAEVKSSTDLLAEKMDIEKTFARIRGDFVSKSTNLDKYLSDSVTTKEIEKQDNNESTEKSSDENSSATEEIVKYDTTSKDISKYMQTSIEKIDSKILELLGKSVLEKIQGVSTKDRSEEAVNRAEVANLVTKELTNDDKAKLLEELYNQYNEFAVKENKFYLDNMNLLLKDTTNKVSDINMDVEYESISDIRYLYLELPNLLEKEMKIYDLKNILEINNLTKDVKAKLSTLVNINVSITKEYNKKVS